MKNCILILFFAAAVVLPGCRHSTVSGDWKNQGMVVYRVSYPEENKYGIKSSLFPKEVILIFKEKQAVFIASGAMGMVQLVNLLDGKNHRYVSLLIDNLRANYGTRLTAEEILENENARQLDFTDIEETKVIAGTDCKATIVRDKQTGTSDKFFYNEKIPFCYDNSPFKDFPYLFTEYTHTINGLTMKLVAEKIDLVTPVDTTLFTVKGEYKWLSQKEFFNFLSSI